MVYLNFAVHTQVGKAVGTDLLRMEDMAPLPAFGTSDLVDTKLDTVLALTGPAAGSPDRAIDT